MHHLPVYGSLGEELADYTQRMLALSVTCRGIQNEVQLTVQALEELMGTQ